MDLRSLLQALTEESSPVRARLAALWVDHQLAQPLSAYVTKAEAKDMAGAILGPQALASLVADHVTPAVIRDLSIMAESGELAGVWVEPRVRARAVDLFARADGPRLPYLAGALPPGWLSKLLAPVFQDVLLDFANRILAMVGGAGARGLDRGLLGKFGREVGDRSKRWADLGRNLLGGLGLEERLQAMARDFSDQAVSTFRTRLGDRLRSPEGQALIRELTDHVIDQVVHTPLSVVLDDVDRLPPTELLALLPQALSHITSQPLFDELLSQQLSTFYAQHGAQPLGEFLEPFGLREPVRVLALAAAERTTRAFFASPEFAAWLQAVPQEPPASE